jgi:hypothetical protein
MKRVIVKSAKDLAGQSGAGLIDNASNGVLKPHSLSPFPESPENN